jgi:hypothetical protein
MSVPWYRIKIRGARAQYAWQMTFGFNAFLLLIVAPWGSEVLGQYIRKKYPRIRTSEVNNLKELVHLKRLEFREMGLVSATPKPISA